ncbi:hypothetical protein P9112_002831 [Eukaryota sp. TZLM1-RC]
MRGHVLLVLLAVLVFSSAKPITPELRCSACRTIVKLINEGLANLPQRNVNVGWRIDSQGKRVTKQVPLSKSHEGVSQVLDELCEDLGSYGIYTDPTGVKHFKSLSGGSISGSFSIDGESSAFFGRECRRVAGGFESEISDIIFAEEDLYETLCLDVLEVCDTNMAIFEQEL